MQQNTDYPPPPILEVSNRLIIDIIISKSRSICYC